MRFASLVLIAAAAFAQSPLNLTAPQVKPAKPAPAASALDKKVLEAYVRHLFVWAPNTIAINVGDPKPSHMQGFLEITVHASATGAARDLNVFVSKDGKQIFIGNVYDAADNPFRPDLDKLKTDFQPSFGTPGAPVVIVVFSDFECPYCAQEAKVIRENIAHEYPKQVRVYFMDFPLEAHTWSKTAAALGRCIFRQSADSFWIYHDWIFDHQKDFTDANLKEQVMQFSAGKVDAVQFQQCVNSKAGADDVAKTVALGKSLQIDSTPTMFVNGRRLAGGVDWPNLKAIIDYEIEYQKTAKNAGEDCGCTVKLPSPIP